MTDETTPPPPPESSSPGTEPTTVPSEDDKTMAMLAHLLGIVLCFIGPLIIWLVKKDESKFVDDQGKEALNFQLMLLIAYVVGFATTWLCIGMLILPATWLVSVIFSIIGGIKAKEGVAYRYPFNLRMVK